MFNREKAIVDITAGQCPCAACSGKLSDGIFTVVGGYFGSRVIVRRERQREQRELVGAIQIARTEMASNVALIDLIISDDANRQRHRLSEASYRSVEHLLAAGLPLALFAWLVALFNQVRMMNAVVAGQSSLTEANVDDLSHLRERLGVANGLLRDYLDKIMKVNLGDIPLPVGHTAEDIERGLTQRLFGNGASEGGQWPEPWA